MEEEPRTDPELGLDTHLSAVPLNYLARDLKTETETGLAHALGFLGLEEALPHAGQVFLGNADAGVHHADYHAVDRGLRRVDKRRGFRKPRRNVIAEGRTADNFKHDRWARRMTAGDIVPAVVRSVNGTSAQLRIGPLHGELTKAGIQWTRRASPS